ncbi:MAG: HPr(Ser) kinase/phosphatase [Lentisphaerae bacterium GWF2_57_35]|nr:MAG: HPr(Ser) kinase/phosphatase [Lentisphaerae bacterium GWF2_57_35]
MGRKTVELTVQQFFESGHETLGLKIVGGGPNLDRIIREIALNRPGLALAGFFQYFAYRRIQVIGLAEIAYLKSLTQEEQNERLDKFFSKQIPCIVVTRNRQLMPNVLKRAEAFGVPVLRTAMITGAFINAATIMMENLCSPRVRAQGTMVDILGIGVLLEGEPGIGKSETALALIERGHSLVADDITVLRRDNAGAILGSAVEITRYHMEIRGLGIIHVPSLFGVASMRSEMKLDLIIRLHHPQGDVEDDRTGLAVQYRDVLNTKIPFITLPVGAGRDMAHVVEVAALNQKLKQLGHDAAKELDEKMMMVLSRKHSK